MGKNWTNGPMSEQHKANLANALKSRWASGTRKKNPPEMYEVTSQKMRERYADGRHTWRPTREMCSKGGLTVTEKKLETNRRIAKGKVGVPNPPGPSERGVNNWKAKFWVLVTPDKDILAGVNLNEIVRRNPHLFHPNDLKTNRNGSMIKAAQALRGLFYLRKHKDGSLRDAPGSWKGWMASNTAEMVKNIPDNCQLMLRPQSPSRTCSASR